MVPCLTPPGPSLAGELPTMQQQRDPGRRGLTFSTGMPHVLREVTSRPGSGIPTPPPLRTRTSHREGLLTLGAGVVVRRRPLSVTFRFPFHPSLPFSHQPASDLQWAGEGERQGGVLAVASARQSPCQLSPAANGVHNQILMDSTRLAGERGRGESLSQGGAGPG